MPVHESDICVIGGGITAAMLVERLSELKPSLRVTVVEAGRSIFDRENRGSYHRRALDYGEHPWHDDYIEDQRAKGMISMTMAVGGQALHWGGACNRFSEEDVRLKSIYGLADDWPIEWDELERYYVQAERRLNVAGDPSPYSGDRRSAPYPQPAMPLSYNLQVLRRWAEQSGMKFSPLPLSRNIDQPFGGRGACGLYDTCGDVCPTGARYSPDYTYQQLIAAKKVTLHDRMLVRKLVLDDGRDTVAAAHGYHQDRPNELTEYRAPLFVLASGQCWSPHLLLLSANSRFPQGLANRSGLVGRFMNGHKFISAQAQIDDETFPGQNMTHSLISREYFRCAPNTPFVRHDTRVWESSAGKEPRLRDGNGRLLLGDELLSEWRSRALKGSSVRLRAYYDSHPSRDSRLTLDPTSKNRYGDPMPAIEHRLDAAAESREGATMAHVTSVFERMVRASNGRLTSKPANSTYWDHPAGGCRMGTNPSASVCNSHGRTYDHENLFVIGAPTLPTGGCTNGTLTFVALTLRSAEHIAGVM
ncbi:MAG TPA: GMC family oxidoreductase [Vicinamibacterales bacterium]|nr:GMC family oxidoreductase [Vicinamibacterales bacterium]